MTKQQQSSQKERVIRRVTIALVIVAIACVLALAASIIVDIYTELSKTDSQHFAEELAQTTVVQTDVLLDLKEVCKSGLEKAADIKVEKSFINVDTLDSQYRIIFNVLTDEEKHLKYEISSSLNAPLAIYLLYGDQAITMANGETKTNSYGDTMITAYGGVTKVMPYSSEVNKLMNKLKTDNDMIRVDTENKVIYLD